MKESWARCRSRVGLVASVLAMIGCAAARVPVSLRSAEDFRVALAFTVASSLRESAM